MSVYIREFRKEDFLAFEPIEILPKAEIEDMVFAQAIEDSGLAITGVKDGKVVGCGGVHPTECEDQGEVWFRISKECLNHKIETLRTVKQALKIIEETYPFEQLNAVIKGCFEKSVRLVESLGFARTQTTTHNGKEWFIYSKFVNKDNLIELESKQC